MKTKSFRMLTSLVLAIMMVVSMCVTGLTVFAADDAKVIYLKPSTNWCQDDARFAMYVFNKNTNQNTWASMTDEDADGYFEAAMPAGEWTSVIFTRMNPATKDNNWDNKWNQSLDLDFLDKYNCFNLNEGEWDNANGNWSQYTPVVPTTVEPETTVEPDTTEEPTTVEPEKYSTYALVGQMNNWDAEANKFELTADKNVVTLTTDLKAGSYEFKLRDGDTWYGNNGTIEDTTTATSESGWTMSTADGNCKLNAKGGTYTFSFNTETKKLIITVAEAPTTEPATTEPTTTEPETTEPTEPTTTSPVHYSDFSLVGDMNNWDDQANKFYSFGPYYRVMTEVVLEPGTYEFKIKNGDTWYGNNGTIVDTTEATSKVGWTMSTSEGNCKLQATGGKYTFVFTDNGTNILFVTHESVEPTEEPTTTEPVTTEPKPTEPVEDGYALFGYINGANYGCEEDWETIGEYVFVNGSLTTTFAEDSYVAVKSTDNTNWYMTDGFQKDVQEVTLYNTSKLGENADKLFVPAGVEVTFTLVNNGNDTFKLSYVANEEPTEPTTVEPTTAEPTTAEPTTVQPTTAEPAEGITIYMAAPRVAPGRNVWSNVDLYYGNETNVLKVARIHMEATDLCATNINSNGLKTVRSGNWHVFKAVLTADQVAALDAAKYIGFVNANNHNYKTSSKFDIRMGGSIADYDGMTFMINGATANTEVAAYTGEWQNADLFVPEYQATTVKFACPEYWKGGVYLYYGSSQVITTVDKIEMTPAEGKTYTVESVGDLKFLKPGDWQVYTVDLTAEQVEMIDNCSVTGFHSGANIYIKTTSARNAVRNNSIADYQNYVFVINSCLDPASEKAAYLGQWKWMK